MGLGGSAPLELHARLPHAERASADRLSSRREGGGEQRLFTPGCAREQVDAAFRASEGGRLFLEALGALGVQ